jgi:hypothetical protein
MMKVKKRKLYVFIFFGLGLVSWIVWHKVIKVSNIKKEDSLVMYINQKGGYQILSPRGWKVTEVEPNNQITNRIMFEPQSAESAQIGNIGQISVTVVASPSAAQELSTMEEFEKWLAVSPQVATSSEMVKIQNDKIGGEQAIRFGQADMVPDNIDSSFWSVTDWMRKNQINYYINMLGNGMLGQPEEGWWSRILNSFRWL